MDVGILETSLLFTTDSARHVISSPSTTRQADRNRQPHAGNDALSIHSAVEKHMGQLAAFNGIRVQFSTSSMGYSLFQLLYGFEPKRALEFLGHSHEEWSRRPQMDRFLAEMQLHREIARQMIARAQEKQATSYNKGHKQCEFSPGDFVLVNPHELEWSEAKGEGTKLVQRWIGPFEVTECINLKTYRLQMDDRYPGANVFNSEHLRKYVNSLDVFGARTILPDTRSSPRSEEYEIEKIVAHRIGARRRIQYLIRWKGTTPMQDMWQSERDLHNAAELLCNYKRTAKL